MLVQAMPVNSPIFAASAGPHRAALPAAGTCTSPPAPLRPGERLDRLALHQGMHEVTLDRMEKGLRVRVQNMHTGDAFQVIQRTVKPRSPPADDQCPCWPTDTLAAPCI